MRGKGAFFIDKDGTIVKYVNLPSNPSIELIPKHDLLEEVIEGLKYIVDKGFPIFIVSNQPWISKGIMKKEEVDEIFKILIQKLSNQGIEITDYIYCPHSKLDNCLCRKPQPKMILDLAKKYEIDLEQSFFVGDSDKDIHAGENAGIKTILVKTGEGIESISKVKPNFIIENLNAIGEIL